MLYFDGNRAGNSNGRFVDYPAGDLSTDQRVICRALSGWFVETGLPSGSRTRYARYSVDRFQAVARLSAYSFQRVPEWAAVHRSRQSGWAR